MFDVDKILGKQKKTKKQFSNIVDNMINNKFNSFGASKKMQNKWFNMNHVQRNKARKKYRDYDGDRIPDIFDCNPFNIMRQDTTNLYTWQSPKEEIAKNPKPADDSTKRRMTPGRSTGWTGTGVYGYRDKFTAVQEAKESPSLYKGRKLYKMKVEKPLVFPHGGYDKFMEASKYHRMLSEDSFENNKPLVGKVLKDYNEAGIKTSERQLFNTVKQSEKNNILPSTLLLKERGFDSVIADSSNNTYRTGSVALGREGDFVNKLEPTDPETITDDEYDFYNWEDHSQKSPSYQSWEEKRRIAEALRKTKQKDEEQEYSDFLEDTSNEAYLDVYKDPKQKQELFKEYEKVEAEEKERKAVLDEELRLLRLKHKILNDSDNDGLLDVADAKPY